MVKNANTTANEIQGILEAAKAAGFVDSVTGQQQTGYCVPYHPGGACPSCGRCPTCGRGGYYYPPYPQPYWYGDYGPNITCGGNTQATSGYVQTVN